MGTRENKMVDGFWTVEFDGVPGFLGGAIAVLTKNHVVGGDSQYFYIGLYDVKDALLSALIQVTAFVPGATTIFGSKDRTFSIQITGQVSEQVITGTAMRPDQPTHSKNYASQASRITYLKANSSMRNRFLDQ
jgi:T3SS negative regulator,GrlR